MFNTPILITIFNRPKDTARLYSIIKKVKPTRLYICADGPRPDKPEDKLLCELARKEVSQQNWPCKVYKNYAKTNMGVRDRMITGITWFFDHEQEGIILEDDLEPDLSFFPFCRQLLQKYRNKPEVMHIGGNNYQLAEFKLPVSYYFSKYSHNWGWATWRRAWKKYDKSMKTLDEYIDSGKIREKTFNLWEYRYWRIIFKNCQKKSLKAWDYNWLYSIWKNNGIAICPSCNLVRNYGFSKDATNTSDAPRFLKNLPLVPMKFPLKHPTELIINRNADYVVWQRIYKVPPLKILKNLPNALFMVFNSQ